MELRMWGVKVRMGRGPVSFIERKKGVSNTQCKPSDVGGG